MRLCELLLNVEVQSLNGDSETIITGITADSRQVQPGFLFAAIPGEKADGHDFLAAAVAAGASALLVSRPLAMATEQTSTIVVEDTRRALSRLAANFYGQPANKLRIIGVTGTNGKTTTTHLIEAMLQAAGINVGIIGTLGWRAAGQTHQLAHTTPDALELQQILAEMVKLGVDYVVMEVSSHALALHRVVDCTFRAAVFTNLTQDHLDFHRTMEDYQSQKQKLFAGLGAGSAGTEDCYAVLNIDDAAYGDIAAACRCPILTYGIRNQADVTAREISYARNGSSLLAVFPDAVVPVKSKLPGEFNVYNLLAALAVGWKEGIAPEQMATALELLAGVPGRMEPVEQGQEFAILIDYAHTPDGLANVLAAVKPLTAGKIISVFGCGGDRDRTKRPLMGRIAAEQSDLVIITSDNPRTEPPHQIITDILAGVIASGKSNYEVWADRRQAISRALARAEAGDVVLIAGKGHESYQIVGTERRPFDDREVARDLLLREKEEPVE